MQLTKWISTKGEDMHKKFLLWLSILALSVSLCACSSSNVPDDNETDPSSTDVTELDRGQLKPDSFVSADTKKYSVLFDENEVFEDQFARQASELIDPAIKNAVEALNTIPEPNYEVLDWDSEKHPTARDVLVESGDTVTLQWYDFIYEKMSKMEYFLLDPQDYGGCEELYIPLFTAEVAVIEDHREVYMCGTIWPDENETVYPVFFMPDGWVDTPCEDKELLRNEIKLYNAIEDRIIEKMPVGLNNYEKICYFTFVIISNAEYDYTNYDDEDCFFYPYDALVKGSTVCRGYAMTLYELCRREGVSCWYCSGSVPEGDHAWVRVDTTDGVRGLDITWFDSSSDISSYFGGASEYLFMTEDDMDYYGYREGVH
jgi:hypothetical protein